MGPIETWDLGLGLGTRDLGLGTWDLGLQFPTDVSQSVLFGSFVVEFRKHVEDKVGIADDIDHDGEFILGNCELEGAAVDLDYVPECRVAVVAVAFRIDDLPVVERNIGEMEVVLNDEKPRHLGTLDDLYGVKNTYKTEIAGKRHIGPDFLRRAVAVDREVGAPRTADRFKAGRDGYTGIEQLCFLQPIVCKIELLSVDIQTNKRQTLPGSFIQILLLYADVPKLFAERDRSRTALKRIVKKLECFVR